MFFSVCSCGQRVEEDDHHRRHLVLPLAGSGGSERRKIFHRHRSWEITKTWNADRHTGVHVLTPSGQTNTISFSPSLPPPCAGAVLSHSLPGQLGGGLQGPHPPRDGHEGERRTLVSLTISIPAGFAPLFICAAAVA